MDPNLHYIFMLVGRRIYLLGDSWSFWSSWNFESICWVVKGRVIRRTIQFSCSNQQIFVKHPLCARVSFGWVSISLFKVSPTLMIFHTINEQMWKPKGNYKGLSSASHCDAGPCPLVIGQVNWKITPGWPVLGNVLIYISLEKATFATCLCVAVLEWFYHIHRIKSFFLRHQFC